MTLRTLSAACLLAALSGCQSSPPRWQAADTVLTGMTLVHVDEARVEADQTLVIRDGLILAAGPASTLRLPAGTVPAATGGYVIPGLRDMHVHALSDPDAAIERIFPLFIANGITGVRDMGSTVPEIQAVRRRLAEDPSILAPDLYVSGPLLDGVKLQWYGDLPLVLSSPEDVERELPKLVAAGVDFFKVYDQLPLPAYEAVLDFGRRNNMPVAGHPPTAAGLSGAAKAGQLTIEHLSIFLLAECTQTPGLWFDRTLAAKFGGNYDVYYQTAEDFRAAMDRARCQGAFADMASAGTWFTPTLVMELNDRSRVDEAALAFIPDASRAWCDTQLALMDAASPERRTAAYGVYRDILTDMRRAGVRLLAGSDMPNNCLVPGHALHWELQQLVDLGLTPMEALRAATVEAAAVMREGGNAACLRPGCRADLVVLSADPLAEIANTQAVTGVVRRGVWLGPARLAAMQAQALQAARTPPLP